MNEALKEKLLKLHRMSKQGVGGEREVAERKLNELLSRNGMTLQSLDPENTRHIDVFLATKTEMEKVLAAQVLYAVRDGRDFVTWSYKRKKGIGMTCPQPVAAEAVVMFDVLKRHLKAELGVFWTAFVMKNNIYPPSVPPIDKQLTPEQKAEQRKASLMAAGMDKAKLHQQIEQKA